MPTTARIPNGEHDRDQVPPWITVASMFVGQCLDKRSAVGAYVAAAVTLVASVIVLLVTRH
jgi:hypothetical protein